MTALVLLPGLDGTGALFADFLAQLPPSVRPIVIAYPPDQPLGYRALEALVRARLPEGEPYVLLAESFSGPIGIAIAASAPPGLRGLVLCASFARNPLPALAWSRPLLGAVPLAALPTALLGLFVLGRHTTAARRAALAQSLARVAPAVLRARARAALSVDASEALRRVTLPLLYLQAAEDRVVPRASANLLRSLVPQTELVEFAAPHFLLQVRPADAARVVARFMATACPAPVTAG